MCSDTLINKKVDTSVEQLSTKPERVHNSKSNKLQFANSKNKNLLSYSTPVLNNSTILQKVDRSTIKPNNKQKLPHTYRANNSHFLSNMDNDVIIRLRRAEKILLDEERKFGRYLRDKEGKLVPSWKEEKSKFLSDLQIDDNCIMQLPAKTKPDLAPFAIQSGCGHNPTNDKIKDSFSENNYSDGATQKDSGIKVEDGQIFDLKGQSSTNIDFVREETETNLSSKLTPFEAKHAKKTGGELYSMPHPGTRKGRKRPPLGRHRQYTINLGVKSKKIELERLEKSLRQAKLELEDMVKNQNQHALDDTYGPNRQTKIALLETNIKNTENQIKLSRKQLQRKEYILSQLRLSESEMEDKQRSMYLERKRRMLDSEQTIPDVEILSLSIEDISASLIQKYIRGRLTRNEYISYKRLCQESAKLIQAGVRGMFGRKKSSVFKTNLWSAIDIQRMQRGFSARKYFRTLVSTKIQNNMSVQIQRRIRGVLGRMKVIRIREFTFHAVNVMDTVCPSTMTHYDLVNLARLISELILSTSGTRPPNAVLFVIRLICAILGKDSTVHEVKEYNHLGVGKLIKVDTDITWEIAVKLLRRGQRLLRKIRNMTGLVTMNFIKLRISQDAINLYRAYKLDRSYCKENCLQLKSGSKVTQNLMTWVDSIMMIYNLQTQYFYDTKESFTVSSGIILNHQKKRKVEAHMIVCREVLKTIKKSCLDPKKIAMLEEKYDSHYSKYDVELLNTNEKLNWYNFRESNIVQHLIYKARQKYFEAKKH